MAKTCDSSDSAPSEPVASGAYRPQPAHGKIMSVAASTLPVFKPGVTLRKAVGDGAS